MRYRLHLYEPGQLKEVAQLQSSSNLPAIEDVVWLPDSRRVAFLGENPAEKHQVFLLDTETRVLRPLSDSPHPVVAYAINAGGSQVACVSKPSPRQIFPDPKKGIIDSPRMVVISCSIPRSLTCPPAGTWSTLESFPPGSGVKNLCG